VDVQGLRDYCRRQLEVDDEELPDTQLNVYLQEAFDRTMAMSNLWPRNQYTWDLQKVVGEPHIDLPPNVLEPSIISVVATAENIRLAQIDHSNAEDLFTTWNTVTVGTPVYYSIWDRKLWPWPRVSADTEDWPVTIRGYRQPVWANGASDIPDLDARLHVTLCYFALSLAYAAQEDEVLEAAYMARWERDLSQQMKSLFEAPRHRPLVMHGGTPVGGVTPWVINLPGP